jgi:hypothetical protein
MQYVCLFFSLYERLKHETSFLFLRAIFAILDPDPDPQAQLNPDSNRTHPMRHFRSMFETGPLGL